MSRAISSSCLINRRRRISSPTSSSSAAPVREVRTSAPCKVRCSFSTPISAPRPSARWTSSYGSSPSLQATTSASDACACAFSSSSDGTMSVAPSGRTASAISLSWGSARKPVRYAMDTGRVMYATPSLRFSIHSRTSASGDFAATDLLNARDAHRVGATGRHDLHHVAHAVADQSFPERGLIAHAARFRVGLSGTDDAIALFILTVLSKPDGIAHRDLAVGGAPLDDHVVLDDRLELLDAGLHHSPPVPGGLLLEVLGKVAQLARRFDLGDDRGALHRGELPMLSLDRFQPLWRDGDVAHKTSLSAPGKGGSEIRPPFLTRYGSGPKSGC